MKTTHRKISEYKVLESAAGFYIGRTYHETPEDCEPYDRYEHTPYFKTREEAQKCLINEFDDIQ